MLSSCSCRRLFNWGLVCPTHSLTLSSTYLSSGSDFFPSLPPLLDELPSMKMLLLLLALLSAALPASTAPPTCYSRVLSLSKEITESFKELQTSKTVSPPKNCSCTDTAGCHFWHGFLAEQNLKESFLFPAGLVCGDAAQAVLGHTRKFARFFLTVVSYCCAVKAVNEK